ncbi:MAG: LacI family DNA-binding transcriptional regulator [Lentisphaeria bacterium]|nr:LacI family DNA-binding transcriptional regulator [Lentisphaeria bacterium]
MKEKSEPARRSCSIRELAKYVGLSTCTVSKVLNNRAGKKIPPATQERVLAAAKELDYVPNVNAQRLFQRRSGVIGLLVPASPLTSGNVFGDTHFVDILSGMEPILEESGYHLMLLFRNEKRRPEERYLKLFRAGTIDGLLIWGAFPGCEYHTELEENGVPYLFITSTPANAAPGGVNLVASDYRTTAREVTGAMLRAGCRRFLYLAGPEKSSVTAAMRRGVDEALAGSGAELVVRFSRYMPDEARDAALAAWKEQPFDGILNVSRDTAPGILEAADSLGIGGESLRMATLDCAANRPLLPQEVAAGQVNDLAIGRIAIESLLELIERKSSRVEKLIPGTPAVNPRFFPAG